MCCMCGRLHVLLIPGKFGEADRGCEHRTRVREARAVDGAHDDRSAIVLWQPRGYGLLHRALGGQLQWPVLQRPL